MYINFVESARGTPRARAGARRGPWPVIVGMFTVLCSCAVNVPVVQHDQHDINEYTNVDANKFPGWVISIKPNGVEFTHERYPTVIKFTFWSKDLNPFNILSELSIKMDSEEIAHTEVAPAPEIPGAVQIRILDKSIHEMRTVAFTTDIHTAVGILVSKSEEGSDEASTLLSKIGHASSR